MLGRERGKKRRREGREGRRERGKEGRKEGRYSLFTPPK
jgi:hypothetical protein